MADQVAGRAGSPFPFVASPNETYDRRRRPTQPRRARLRASRPLSWAQEWRRNCADWRWRCGQGVAAPQPPLPAEVVAQLEPVAPAQLGDVVLAVVDDLRADVRTLPVGQTVAESEHTPGFILEQTVHQGGDKIVVSCLAAGDAEPVFETDRQIMDGVDAIMSCVFGRPLTRVLGWVNSWTRDPWSRAVVRAPIGDQRASVLPLIAAALDGRVFFAGEHTEPRVGPGGIEGAIKSGYRVTKEILAER